ncbi:T9SS type A sorting domain-containing protein [Aureibaculum sp. A20]|uniref:T9SS type A sorting domain-containing protein n=1 Tax=Aureibaculum flavum TaxID=2795986 RepID=A0ABS0WNH9_9FLAO|nr:T9SS type A sorting domain-containing protein [Aureibaculum flavum]MBJ2173516.1 T9SS type A sorting domain-containing protein [Aureibaculum flavum]
MKTKLLLVFSLLLFVMSLHGQNTITIVDPPLTVSAGTYVDITFDYTLDEAEAYAFIRFKDAGNLTEVFKLVNLAAGTETLSLEIPADVAPGDGYSYQAQLFTTGWAHLATQDFEGITVEDPSAAPNIISIIDPPTTVTVSTMVDIKLDYKKDVAVAYALIRFKDATGNLEEAFAEVTDNSGTVTVSVEAPAILGSGYSLQAQLFTTDWEVLASDDVDGVTVEELSPNTITIVNPPATVPVDEMVDITLSYTKDIAAAYALIRFTGPNGNLEQIYTEVTDNTGTITLSVKSPATAGSDYGLQAQLFSIDWDVLDTENISGITVAAPNSITIVNPPATVTAGTNVDITFSYTKDVASAWAFIRFKDAAGNVADADAFVAVTDNSGNVTISVPTPTVPGTEYYFQAQLFTTEWANIATEDGATVVVEEASSEPNSITIVNPPATVTAGTNVDITFSYTKDVASAWAFIRFKDAAGNVADADAFVAVTDNSGTVTISVPTPTVPGTEYYFQAQLFTTEWTNIATEDGATVIVEEASSEPNSITIVNPPATVTAGTNVDITFSYTKDVASAWAFIRFKDAAGNVADADAFVAVTDNSGTVTISVPTPTAPGTEYYFQAQLFTTEWTNIATEDGATVIVESGTSGENSITIVNPPTTVTAGATVNFNLSYTKNVAAAYALIRFIDATGNLEQSFVEVTENVGDIVLGLRAPLTVGPGYSIQAQLFTTDWAHLATENVTDITVEAYVPSGVNTLEIVDTSMDPINNGTLRRVNIKYNLLQTSKILVEVRDNEVAAGSNKIGEVWVELPPGNETIGLDLIVDNGWPGETNRIQAILFEGGTSWGTISIPEIPYILVGKGDGTITYRGQPSEEVNGLFSQDLGDGYWSNYYIADGWKGPLKTNFGPFGSPSWIEYENQNVIAEGHKEFDIKIQKFSWHDARDTSVDRGYPKALKDIDFPLNTTMEGQWSPESGGKGQINMTAWVTENGDMSGNRVDIIVHTFHNGGKTRVKFDNNTNADNHDFNNIGEFTANNGLTYQILRTLPGYLGEVASYNLVPDAIVQADPTADYTTDVLTANVDMKDIIDNLIAKEAAYTGTKVAINDTWQINGLEWTVVGQSENTDSDGQLIPSGHGKFTFNSYSIPDLVKSLSADDYDLTLQNLTIYPNPFTDSFTYEYDSDLSDEVIVELFTIDGRKVKMIKNNDKSYGNRRTINTEHLSNGMYIVRITSGDIQETRKLLKI